MRSRAIAIVTNVFLAIVALTLVACSGPDAKKDGAPVERATRAESKPGTAAWTGGALKLPADSPVVLTGKIDRFSRAAVQLKEWLSADPAMFGESGEELVGQLDVYWSLVVAFFGGELSDPQVWKRRGIDPDRASYMGFYPLGPDGRSVLDAADTSIRASFEFGDDVELADALHSYADDGLDDLPTGFNSALKRDIAKYQPITGMRFVVPVAEQSAFTSFFMGLVDAVEFREEKTADDDARVFSAAGEFPAVRLEFDGPHAVIDVVVAPVDVSTVAQEAEQARKSKLVRAVELAAERFGAGRPAAPAPLDDPVVSLSFFQPDVAQLARLRGYQRTLTEARTLSVEDRDVAVFFGAVRTERLAQNWYGDQSGFEGLIYGLEVGAEGTNKIAGLTMTLVSDKERADLPVNTPTIGLGVEDQSVGMSLDFGPLFDDEWQSWLGLDNAHDQLDLFDDGDFDPWIFALTMPRNVALIAANLAGEDEPDVGDEFGKLLTSELPNVSRAELAVLSPDLSSVASAPRFAVLFMLDREADSAERSVTAQSARDFVIATSADLTGVDVEIEKLPPLTEGWSQLAPNGLTVHHVDWVDDENPRLLVVVGLDEEAAKAQRTRLTDEAPDSRDEVAFFFARPSAFIELLSGEQMDGLEPLDAPILAQRLGPVVAWVKPRRAEDANSIHFKIELRRPPKL